MRGLNAPCARADGGVPGIGVRAALACSIPLVSLASLLGACGDFGPTPEVAMVTPNAAYSNVDVPVVVDAAMLRAGLVVDLSGENASFDYSSIHMALVGDDPGLPATVPLGPVQPAPGPMGTTFVTTVPAGQQAGTYGLRITPPSGHATVAHGQFIELGPDTVAPTVGVDSPLDGAIIGVRADKPTTVTVMVHADDGYGELAAVNWSTSNGAMGSCLLPPLAATGAPPGQIMGCPATFDIQPLDPADGLGSSVVFNVCAADVACNSACTSVTLIASNWPEIESFERTYGALDGQQPITIHGDYFLQDAQAFIDANPIIGVAPGERVGGDVVDPQTIVGLTPRNSRPHDATVSVQTMAGVSDGPYPFRYTSPPTPRLVQPATGPASGGTRITIAGNDLLSGVSISFGATFEGSVPMYNYQYTADDKVVACLPPGEGTVTVWASDPVTGLGSAADAFTYDDDPDSAATLIDPQCLVAVPQ